MKVQAIFEVAVSRVVFTREVGINYFSKTFEISNVGWRLIFLWKRFLLKWLKEGTIRYETNLIFELATF